jgi:hypothetical protein
MFGATRKCLAGMVSALTMTLVLVLMLAPTASAQGPVAHRVHAGGPDNCTAFGARPGCEANFSLLAIEFADGRVAGQYTDRSARGHGFQAVIDCLSIAGNDAWISGVIIQGTLPGGGDSAGLPVATRVRDNGTSAHDSPDEISYSFVGDDTPCTDQFNYPLFPVPQGQVVVE